ncbi:MAG: pyruvate ferredoxin oxidoreductase [Phycisphaerae bacterium]|nr:pyruvate ferredoxin oxidoreductase [Phycisphaerae bacterium]
MARALVTGNYAAGYTLSLAGESNREAMGCAVGAYPITPQTEIIETVAAYKFSKGRMVAVESEHSAMAVCIGASLAGARAFTASSSNGLAYMVENVYMAGFYRLPIVMIAVNRTLGPPWNIWTDQSDSLMLRDTGWIQLYAAAHQDLVDAILLAFRIAEDHRVLLPVLVSMDGFLVSHTSGVVELPELEQVERYLPNLDLPHRLRHEHPVTVGGMTFPHETEHHRKGMIDAMDRVPEVLREAIEEFEPVFGRRPRGAMAADFTEDAETVLIACNTMSRTLKNVIRERRKRGEKIGMIETRMFRPLIEDELRAAIGPAKRVGILDRNISPGSGGVFWREITSALQGHSDVLVQDYLVGLGGGDVTPAIINEIIDDLVTRKRAVAPIWKEVAA